MIEIILKNGKSIKVKNKKENGDFSEVINAISNVNFYSRDRLCFLTINEVAVNPHTISAIREISDEEN